MKNSDIVCEKAKSNQKTYIVFCEKASKFFSCHPFLTLFAVCMAFAAVFDFTSDKYDTPFLIFFVSSLVFSAALCVYWYTTNRLTHGKIIFLITAVSLLVRLAFVLANGLTDLQHDIGTFRETSGGHAGYILKLYDGVLPDKINGQYYHPPLHYMLEALWLRFLTLIGVSFETATHYVTVPTLFYASSSVLICYRIFREFGFSEKASSIAYAVTAFHPAFFIAAGSYNNDTLCAALTLATFLFLIKWYKKPDFQNIVLIAMCLGLGMMSKLSAVYITPVIAAVFIYKFFTEKNKAEKINQFGIFLGISVPLGTWYSFRLLWKFGKPLGYVLNMSTSGNQYVGKYSLTERLFGVFNSFSEGIYFARGEEYANTFYEYCIPSAVLKTSVFGEWHIGGDFTVTEILACMLFIVNIAVIILSLYALIHLIVFKYEKISPMYKIMNILFYLTVTVMFVKYCFDYPQNCTMDFRYILPTVMLGASFIGIYLTGAKQTKSKEITERVMTISVTVFCVCSALLYFLSAYAVNEL